MGLGDSGRFLKTESRGGTGEGMAVDLDEATVWLSKAADQGVVMAARAAEEAAEGVVTSNTCDL